MSVYLPIIIGLFDMKGASMLFSLFPIIVGLISVIKPRFAWNHGFAGQKAGNPSAFDLKLIKVIGYFLVVVGMTLIVVQIIYLFAT
ncbi:hypothetical protein [Paenibacillus aestuarii]|uniref:DUF6199 domain-containing protein n=1 Tax=Paenibacillus aestuarii TaxID=516965 RepID=A0ABW0K316_9BACL|nr:hypothetical protein [Paenibacillus aestuarii]